MVRQTSLESYTTIKNNGLLSEKRWAVYDVLFQYGPATAMELRQKMKPGFVDSQVRARLNELRTLGLAEEKKTRICTITGMNVIEWDVTSRLPIKLDKPKKIKCEHCCGKGYFIEQQTRMF